MRREAILREDFRKKRERHRDETRDRDRLQKPECSLKAHTGSERIGGICGRTYGPALIDYGEVCLQDPSAVRTVSDVLLVAMAVNETGGFALFTIATTWFGFASREMRARGAYCGGLEAPLRELVHATPVIGSRTGSRNLRRGVKGEPLDD